METSSQPDSHFRPGPGTTAPQGPVGSEPGPRWPLDASRGLIGVLVAMALALTAYLALVIGFSAAGVSDLGDNTALNYMATFAQDAAFVAAALLLVSYKTKPSPGLFGLRRTRLWPAIGWVLLAYVAYVSFALLYGALFHPPSEELPDQLHADDSVLLAVLFGLFAVVVAPLVEELFFRGFLFQSLRNSWGPVWAALGSGLIFSGIHFEPDKFVQLAILGVALAFVFQKTDSLWPSIALHGVNNVLAFVYVLTS